MSDSALIEKARQQFHAEICESLLLIDRDGVPTNADKDNRASEAIAKGVAARIGATKTGARLAGQTAGNRFEKICEQFIAATFPNLGHLRPGRWLIRQMSSRGQGIGEFDQYGHLVALEDAARHDAQLAAAMGTDYLIAPDVVVIRELEEDEVINQPQLIVSADLTRLASLRKCNAGLPILHASVSCKWTIRSDRVQNTRAEALNLVRNRKGRLPHVVAVVAEPLPSRLAAIALGTGDLDCVYHFALPELAEAVQESGFGDSQEMLNIIIEGKRLRDISDLPLDLAA